MAGSIFNLTGKLKDDFVKYTTLLSETFNKMFLYKNMVASLSELAAIPSPADGQIQTVRSSTGVNGYVTYKFYKTPVPNMKVLYTTGATDGSGVWFQSDGHSFRYRALQENVVVPAGTWWVYSSVRSVTAANTGAVFGWGGFYLVRYIKDGVLTNYSFPVNYPSVEEQDDFEAYYIDRRLFDRNSGAFVNPMFVDRMGQIRPNTRMNMWNDGRLFGRIYNRLRASPDNEIGYYQLENSAGSVRSRYAVDVNNVTLQTYNIPLNILGYGFKLRDVSPGANAPVVGATLQCTATDGSAAWVTAATAPETPITAIKGSGIPILGYTRQLSYWYIHYATTRTHLFLGLQHAKMAYGMWTLKGNMYVYNTKDTIDIEAQGYIYSTAAAINAQVKAESLLSTVTPAYVNSLSSVINTVIKSKDATNWGYKISYDVSRAVSYHDVVADITFRGNAGTGSFDPNDSKTIQACVTNDLYLDDFFTASPLLIGNRQSLVELIDYAGPDATETPMNLLTGGTAGVRVGPGETLKWTWRMVDGPFDFRIAGFCGTCNSVGYGTLESLDVGVEQISVYVSDDNVTWTLANTETNFSAMDDIKIGATGSFIRFVLEGGTGGRIWYIRSISITGDYV